MAHGIAMGRVKAASVEVSERLGDCGLVAGLESDERVFPAHLPPIAMNGYRSQDPKSAPDA